ncbi:MAG TPA: chemotaxis protein CheC [Virgibacillus sp.]|nr:chemotaxis protein CheC [Virgibacillus sp.]
MNNLSSMQLDVLREIGNIGAGNAATSMSELLNKKINMQIPSVNIVSFDEMMNLIGGPDNVIVAIYFRMQGEAPGTVYFILTVEEAEYLVRQMMPEAKLEISGGEESSELTISILQEIGNILTGSYLSALSDFTNINMKPSVPYLNVDMAGAILTIGLLELSQVSDHAIIIDTKINDGDTQQHGVTGHLFLLPDLDSFPKLFAALGVDDHE